MLAAAPFRPLLAFSGENRYFVAVAEEGELGRLLPLYGVLGAAALALAWQAFRGREVHALPAVVAYPAAAFIAIAAVSLTWTSQLDAGANTLAYFILPFATLLAVAGRAPFPPWMPRALAIVAVSLAGSSPRSASGRRQRTTSCSSRRASRSATPSAPFFRVTSLFRDPSLYGRHVVLGIAVLLVALLRRRINVFVAAALIAFFPPGCSSPTRSRASPRSSSSRSHSPWSRETAGCGSPRS